jgi:hypothetical protein
VSTWGGLHHVAGLHARTCISPGDCPHAAAATLANVAAVFRDAGLLESRRRTEGFRVCWHAIELGQVRAEYVPGTDGTAALARASRAQSTMHRLCEEAGWTVSAGGHLIIGGPDARP